MQQPELSKMEKSLDEPPAAVLEQAWETYTEGRTETRKLGPSPAFKQAVAAALRTAFTEMGGNGLWRHRKRDSRYRTVSRSELQCAEPVYEGTELYTYVGEDGKVWTRPVSEYEDGRFERDR